jgi:hypothetical protein
MAPSETESKVDRDLSIGEFLKSQKTDAQDLETSLIEHIEKE